MLDARLKRLNTLFIFEMRWFLSILKIAFKAVACVQKVWASLGTFWRTSALSERMERGEGVDLRARRPHIGLFFELPPGYLRPAAARSASTLAASVGASLSRASGATAIPGNRKVRTACL